MTQDAGNFADLGLSAPLLKALQNVGYETPSPIQAESIPPLLAGRDILGQAQTGTGKTAAFALPLLQQINLRQKSPQVLVLAPTRELAIQVAEAFQRYAQNLKDFHVLPIYGGQGYEGQLRALKRGPHVIVGTPGRVMDHMRKATLKLDNLKHLVLDEADEMLRMGFIDDVEWVLSQAPKDRQIALFSATMPREIEKVANTYLNNPVSVQIKLATTTASTIEQRYWSVSGLHKLDALTRILEAEVFDGMIIFVRTKTATVELTEKLCARGFRAAALNGDIAQNVRERTIGRLKQGKIDILIATDVAARGLDVERISHVVNYDIPYDTEAYVHRIGRTGRAGRKGVAILFVAKRENRMLRAIEKATGQKIEHMKLPTAADINDQRVQRFKDKIQETLNTDDLNFYIDLVNDFQAQTQEDPVRISAALAKLFQGNEPLLVSDKPVRPERDNSFERQGDKKRSNRKDAQNKGEREKSKRGKSNDIPMETFRIDVGHNDKVTPSNIVGAIANEADIESQFIGQIHIKDDHSTVDLPKGMPKDVFNALKKIWVCQKQLNITPVGSTEPDDKPRGEAHKVRKKPKKAKEPQITKSKKTTK